MSTSLGDPSLHMITKNGHTSLYVSTCNVCGLGVFQTERWKFSRRPLGICHVSCLDETGDGAR